MCRSPFGLFLAAGLLVAAWVSHAVPKEKDYEATAAKDPVAALTCQAGWQTHPANPCIAFGDYRPLASWNDPCVLRDGSRYVMYLTAAMQMPGRPPVQPFRAVSDNGTEWRLAPNSPLLAPGTNSDEFDYQSVETPSVVFFNEKYHLYYTGVRSGLAGPMAIGHATSPDGVTEWTQDADPIVTRRSFPWANLEVRLPTAMFDGATLRLWFAGNNRPQDFLPEVRSSGRTRQFGIGYLTFPDGRPGTSADRGQPQPILPRP